MTSTVQRDAEALYEAATAFIRIYQFRDRNQALRFGVTVVQAYTLDLLLSSQGSSLTAVAEGLRLDKSTTSRIVSGMARRGLITWSQSQNDGRAKTIVASADGRRRYARLRRAVVRDNARMLASYRPSARRAVISALLQLAERVRNKA